MNSHKEHIEVVSYNPHWPKMFEVETGSIKKLLAENCLAIYHIGSTSVPGLAAKPIIDIICVLKDPQKIIKPLETLGYQYKGEYNIPMQHFFSKKERLAVNLHAYEEEHPEIELNLLFRDYLREHPAACDEYAKLKYNLLNDETSFEKNNSPFSGYTLGKETFIHNILKQAGFNRLRLLKCTHSAEWETYHQIHEKQLFASINVAYNRNHPTLTADNHFSFILYMGTQIVSVAYVEFLNKHEAALRSLITDKPYQKRGFGAHMLKNLEKWIYYHGRHTIKLHARSSAEDFYRKLGYSEMLFDDPCIIQQEYIDLGKVLGCLR